jgi:2-dehydro-3-deoxyphosphogluconate aldolase / (4S)-4-hydroxy-2-oxoglutarate aldolase
MPSPIDLNRNIARLLDPGIIAVVRARQADQIPPLSEALVAGGVIAIEITLTTPNAIAAIRAASRALGASALIGVGTVLDIASCKSAIDAGARFVVSPVLRPELIPVAHAAGCPIMLGAYTPTEAQLAHEAGADFVKIFPADGLGPAYIKALRAPLPHLRIVPTGGVTLDTVPAFLDAGCVALGVGSALVSNRILESSAWPKLTDLARAFVQRIPLGSDLKS